MLSAQNGVATLPLRPLVDNALRAMERRQGSADAAVWCRRRGPGVHAASCGAATRTT
jgi:hypothetical protein